MLQNLRAVVLKSGSYSASASDKFQPPSISGLKPILSFYIFAIKGNMGIDMVKGLKRYLSSLFFFSCKYLFLLLNILTREQIIGYK
jgi:hypothetical protein